jgi:uncharacterized protein (TIGR00106 family)
MSVLVEFAMFPTDKGDSVSEYVSRIMSMMDRNDTAYQLTSMGTIFEAETIEEAFNIINRAYKQLEPDCSRVYSTVKLDIRKGKSGRIIQKVESVKKRLGSDVNL